MSISETNKAQRYASIAEVAAAQAKIYADKIILAPDYAAQAEASAIIAQDAANTAQDAVGTVNDLAASASESAASAAASAAEAGKAAGSAIGRSVRAPAGEFLNELPPSSSRQNTVSIFGNDSNPSVKPLADFAILDSNGKIPVSIIPAIALSEPFVVSSQAEMLALDAQVGDIAKRTDLGYSFCLASSPASTLSNWVQLTDDVLSILADKSGAAAIGAEDASGSASTVQTLLDGKIDALSLSSPSGLSLVGAQPQGNLSNIINWVTPEQFGAIGDGVADDTSAIQAAIDYANNAVGGVVSLRSHIYRADNLIFKPLVNIVGQSVTGTTIKARNGWSGLAVMSSIDFQLYSTGTPSTPTANGSYGSSIQHVYFDGNYDNFSGTPSKFSGLGLALAGACFVSDIEISYAPSVGFVHLNFAGSPNTPPSYWPSSRGLRSINSNDNISVKWCGNDCAYIENYDSIYNNVLFGFPARGVGTVVASFWDTSRSVACAHFAGACNVQKGHFYGAGGGHGPVWGHGDYTRGYSTYRWDNIIGETLACAMWVRPTAQGQGGRADFHNINMAVTLPEFGTTYGPYTPGCVIQSGMFISGQQTSRQQSDIGKITFWNFTVSGSNPTVGFMGTHVVLAGENNTLDIDLHRSRFLNPALGGLGVMCAGNDNVLKGRITGFLATDSSGSNSAAIQAQPGSVTDVNVEINRCNVGLRWSTNASQPIMTGRLNITDNVSEYVNSYASPSTNLQKSRLTINIPNGGNKQSALSAAGSVSVTATGQQTITVSGINLPYVPSQSEVSAWCFNDQSTAQSVYVEPQYINYIPAESSTTSLVFRVKVNPVSGAASGQRLGVRIG